MKIGSQHLDPPSQAPQAGASVAQKVSQGAAEHAKSTGTSQGVSVSVSILARTSEEPASATPSEIDMGKVNTMKSAIKSGTFVVNPQNIADKLLSSAQEMLGVGSK